MPMHMKRLSFLLLFLITFTASNAQKIKIAVLDFTAKVDIKQEDVSGISDMFITYFFDPEFTLIERTQIQKILEEQNLQGSSITENEAIKIGQILNVQKVVIGTINITNGEYNVDVRIVNVQTGTIDATDGKTWKGEYRNSMQELATSLMSKFKSFISFTSTQTPTDKVVILQNYLKIYPKNLGNHSDIPNSIIYNINKNIDYGYNDWRIPTQEELSLMKANKNQIPDFDNGNEYMTAEHPTGIVRLVSDGKTFAEKEKEQGKERIKIQFDTKQSKEKAYHIITGNVIWAAHNFGALTIAQPGLFVDAAKVSNKASIDIKGYQTNLKFPQGYRLPTQDEAQKFISSIIKSERVMIGDTIVDKFYDAKGRIFAVPFYWNADKGKYEDTHIILGNKFANTNNYHATLIFPYKEEDNCSTPYIDSVNIKTYGYIRPVRRATPEELNEPENEIEENPISTTVIEINDIANSIPNQNEGTPTDTNTATSIPNTNATVTISENGNSQATPETGNSIIAEQTNTSNKDETTSAASSNLKPHTPTANADSYIEKGIEAMNNNFFESASEYFEKALTLEPENSEAHRLLGNVCFNQQNYKTAIKYYQKSIELYSSSQSDYSRKIISDIYSCMAVAYNRQQNNVMESKCYLKIIELDPSDVSAYLNLAGTYYNMGDNASAIVYYEKANDLKPLKSNSLTVLATAYYNQKDYPNAIKYLQQDIDSGTDPSYAYELLGRIYYDQQKYTEAVNYFKKSIDRYPNLSSVSHRYICLANAYIRLGNNDEAIKNFQKAAQLGNKSAEEHLQKYYAGN